VTHTSSLALDALRSEEGSIPLHWGKHKSPTNVSK
jgi:hypothetical protein